MTVALMAPEHFQQLLLAWFDQHGRKDLPWQQDINAYRVWVSEIMLQQTQVVSVINYFNRFMACFPTLMDLANADLDEVLRHWAGLGYYARARNLHKTAQIVCDRGGEMPQTVEELCALPGIGRSTAGAILSIACGQRQPILDGNVKRVLTRFCALPGWPGETKVSARLWDIAEAYTPGQRTAAYTQAMMDLGATLCTRSKPQCGNCPVKPGCQAFDQGLTAKLPEPRPRKHLPSKQLYLLIVTDPDQQILLEKRPPAGIWGGLWSLPELDDEAKLDDWCLSRGYSLQSKQVLPVQRHSFSHYHLDYTPLLLQVSTHNNNVMEAGRTVWYKARDTAALGLPAPIKSLLQAQEAGEHYDTNG